MYIIYTFLKPEVFSTHFFTVDFLLFLFYFLQHEYMCGDTATCFMQTLLGHMGSCYYLFCSISSFFFLTNLP